MKFHEWLSREKPKTDYNNKTLGEAVGVTGAYIGMILRGKSVPNVDVAAAIGTVIAREIEPNPTKRQKIVTDAVMSALQSKGVDLGRCDPIPPPAGPFDMVLQSLTEMRQLSAQIEREVIQLRAFRDLRIKDCLSAVD